MNVDLIRVLVAVVAVGIGLAGLMLASFRGLRREMMGLRQEMRQDMRGLRHETRQEIRDMRGHGTDRFPYRRTPGTNGASGRTTEGVARRFRPGDHSQLVWCPSITQPLSERRLPCHADPNFLPCAATGSAFGTRGFPVPIGPLGASPQGSGEARRGLHDIFGSSPQRTR